MHAALRRFIARMPCRTRRRALKSQNIRHPSSESIRSEARPAAEDHYAGYVVERARPREVPEAVELRQPIAGVAAKEQERGHDQPHRLWIAQQVLGQKCSADDQ